MDREDTFDEVEMLALPLLAAAVLTQAFGARFGPPPDLTPGQKIKLRILEPVVVPMPPLGFPGPAIRSRALVGTLVAFEPYVRITVLRRGREQTVDWMDVRGIQIPQRRNGLNAVQGAFAGFGVALGIGISAGLFDSVFCVNRPRCDHNAWYYTKRGAIIAVPIGIVAGFFSERWKRVY